MGNVHVVNTRDLVTSLIAGAIIVVVVNVRLIVQTFTSDYDQGIQHASNLISEKISNIEYFIGDFSLSSSLITIIVWGLFGAVVYTVLHIILHEATKVGQDVNVSARYIHPKNFSQSKFWITAFWATVYPLFVMFVTAVWLILVVKVLVPFSSSIVLLALQGSASFAERILLAALSIVTMALCVLGLIICGRLMASIKEIF